jgi:hypothetical protein
VATLVARNANAAMVVPMVGSAFGGSLKFGVRRSVLCWCVWQESVLVVVDIFTFNLVYKKIIKFILSIRFAKIML